MMNLTSNRNLARSKTALENKDFTLAIKYCNEELKKNKRNVEIYLIRGSAYNQLDKIDLAIDDFKKAFELDSSNLDILKKLFFSYSKVKDIQNCLVVCNLIIQKYPSDNDELVFHEICRLLMEREQYENCLKLLKDIIKQSGEHHIYQHLMGLNYYFLKDFDNAIKHFKKALKLENNFKYLLSLTDCYIKINDTDKAYKELLAYWKEYKDTYDLQTEDRRTIVNTLADICIKSNKYDDGINWLIELSILVDNQKEKIEIEHRKAYIYKIMKKYEMAFDIYQTIIRSNSNSITEFIECGDIFMRQGKYKEAYEEYQKVIHLDKYNIPASLNLANLCLMKQDLTLAKDIMHTIYQMNRKNIIFLKQYVDIYFQLLEKERINEEKTSENKAILYENIIELINLNPSDTHNYEKLINLSVEDGKYDSIKETIDKTAEFLKDNRMNLLQGYVSSFIDSSLADSFYDTYLSYQGDESEVNYFKAKSTFMMEDYESALSYVQDALSLNPYHQYATELLIQIYIKLKNWDEALEVSKNLIFNYQNNAEYHFKTGTMFARLKRYEESLEYFENAIRLNNFYLDAFYNLGNVYIKLNLNEEALKCFKVIIYLNPEYNTDVYGKIAKIYKDKG